MNEHKSGFMLKIESQDEQHVQSTLNQTGRICKSHNEERLFFRRVIMTPQICSFFISINRSISNTRAKVNNIRFSLISSRNCTHCFSEITFISLAESTAAKAPAPDWRNLETRRRRRRLPETTWSRPRSWHSGGSRCRPRSSRPSGGGRRGAARSSWKESFSSMHSIEFGF